MAAMTPGSAPEVVLPKRGEPGWAIAHDSTWSYKPALLALVVAIVLGPLLFVIGYAQNRNGGTVVYPALRSELVPPNGATLGQAPTVPAGK